MRVIKAVIVHCSATPKDMDIGAEEIRKWHLDRGWTDIGYHYVIRRDGTGEPGRPLTRMGAHTRGYNANSIGICLVGGVDADDKSKAEFNYTIAQMRTLEAMLRIIEEEYPGVLIRGHNNYTDAKACPVFDVPSWWYGQPSTEANNNETPIA